MPLSSAVRSRLRAAWRAASVAVGAVLLVVATVAGVNAWNVGVGVDLGFAIIPDALPSAPPAQAPARPGAPAPDAVPGVSSRPQNILLLGVDTGGTGKPDAAAVARALKRDAAGQPLRSVMVVHIPASRTAVSVLFVPPDTATPTPSGSPSTAADALSSGVPSAVSWVRGLLGVPVDHVAIFDVAAYPAAVAALRGVHIDVPGPAATPAPEAASKAGVEYVSADAALDLLRSGPAARGAGNTVAEQRLITGLLEAAEREGTFTSLRKIGALATHVSPFVAVDAGLTTGYLSALQLQLGDHPSVVGFATLPTLQGEAGRPAPEPTSLAAIRSALAADAFEYYVARQPGVTPAG